MASFFSAADVKAATFTWQPQSNAQSKDWSRGDSWVGGLAPSVNSALNDFVFASPQYKLANNMQADYTVGGISFATGAGAYTISSTAGRTLTLGAGGFLNNSVLNQTISIETLRLNANQSWNAASGALTFAGTSLNLNGFNLDLSGGNNISIANAISGAGNINKTGSGTLALTGSSLSYSGVTTVSSGTLAVNGSFGGASSSTVIANSGYLRGTGTMGGSVHLQSGSRISAGNSVGQLTTGSQIWDGGSIMTFEVSQAGGTEGAGWDKLLINGGLTINANAGSRFVIDVSSLTLGGIQGNVGDFDNSQSYSWRFVETTGGISGFSESAFDIQTGNFANDTGLGDFNIVADANNLYLTFTPVPEPSTIAMGVLGGVMVFGSMLRRRMKKK